MKPSICTDCCTGLSFILNEYDFSKKMNLEIQCVLTRILKEGSLGSLVMVYADFLQSTTLNYGLELETCHIIN